MAKPDSRLLALGSRLSKISPRCRERRNAMAFSLIEEIRNIPAHTTAGMLVKARALMWLYGGSRIDVLDGEGDHTTDFRLAASIARDFISMAA